MEYKPHEYQKYAIEFVKEHPFCGLFLDMGLGKTVITLTAVECLLYDMFDAERVLIIAPPTVAEDTWPSEIGKWDNLKHIRFSRVCGTPTQRVEALKADVDIYILSNALVPWIVEGYGKKWPFDTVVLDELSAFKGTDTKRFRALKKVRPYISRVIGLTGTPAPNHLIEIWPQLYLLDYGERLGRRVTGFRQRYFYPKKFNGNIVYEYGLQDGAEQRIYDAISDICISMKAVDHLRMPKRFDIVFPVRLDAKEKALYKKLERDYVLEIGGDEIVAANAAVLSNKLLQLSQGAVYGDDRKVLSIHERKLDALEEIMNQSCGQPVLCVYWYKHDLSRIMERLGDRYRVRAYSGQDDRLDWDNGDIDLLCIHPGSCKYGLNLQKNHIMVWFALTWSLEAYQQTVARLWRQGQENSVSIYYIVCEGTMDERVMEVLKGKEKKQNALLDAVKAVVDRVRG